MSGSTSRARPSGSGAGRALRELVDRLRPRQEPAAVARPETPDVRAAVLRVLAASPADGYRIVRVLAERDGGSRAPGPGAVYPTLRLLADEGLVTATATDGTRTWSLTPAGRSAAAAVPEPATPEEPTAAPRPDGRGIARAAALLGRTTALAAPTATPAQAAEIVAALDDARRRILAALAR